MARRKWHDTHLSAGYHLREWHPVADDHPCLGLYTFDGGAFHVSYLEEGHTRTPEYLIEFLDGPTLTVLDHTVVEDYVALHGATKSR